MGALTWGVHWQSDPEPVSFEAELWSAVAQRAAPRAVEPPPPPPAPEPKVKPEPNRNPSPNQNRSPNPRSSRPSPTPVRRTSPRASEKEKARRREARCGGKGRERERLRKRKPRKRKPRRPKRPEARASWTKRKRSWPSRRRKLTKRPSASEKAAEATEKIARGKPAPHDGPGGRHGRRQCHRYGPAVQRTVGQLRRPVNAAIRPNVLLTEDIPGNPKAEVEVRCAPDGTVISRRLARSSGNAAWDKAALAAIDRTGKLPRDVDGRVPSPMILGDAAPRLRLARHAGCAPARSCSAQQQRRLAHRSQQTAGAALGEQLAPG